MTSGLIDDVAGLVEEVRRRLARSPGELTPHRVAEALRAAGRPVGDATVLAVYEALRRDVVGAGREGDRRVDAAVNAERQAVAGGVDRIEQLVEPVGREAQHVQDRPEHLAVD